MINLLFSLFKIIHAFMKNLSFIDSANLFFFALQYVGFLLPSQGLNPLPSALGMQSLNHWTAREVPKPYTLKSRMRKSQETLHCWCKSYLVQRLGKSPTIFPKTKHTYTPDQQFCSWICAQWKWVLLSTRRYGWTCPQQLSSWSPTLETTHKSSSSRRGNTLWCVHTMKYYTAIK